MISHAKPWILLLITTTLLYLLFYQIETLISGTLMISQYLPVGNITEERLSQTKSSVPSTVITDLGEQVLGTVGLPFNKVIQEATAKRMFSLILSITNITQPSVVGMLNDTLLSSTQDLRPLLLILEKFYEEHACPACADTRPLPRPALDARVRLEHTPEAPTLVLAPGGRLGNLMGEYATLFALHKIYNVSAVLSPAFSSELGSHFTSLSLPKASFYNRSMLVNISRDHAGTFSYNGMELAAAGLLGPHQFQLGDYPFEAAIFNAYEEDILREFTFEPSALEEARTRLLAISESKQFTNEESSAVYVGVHVRLTDYQSYMKNKFSVSDVSTFYYTYLARAAAFFLERYSNVEFVVTSDDVQATMKIFQNITVDNIYISKGSALGDLCLLSLCNHTIITFGTFGFWAGYLSGGTTTYPYVESISLSSYPYTKPFFERAELTNFVPIPL